LFKLYRTTLNTHYSLEQRSEIASAFTHGIGIPLSLLGAYFLLSQPPLSYAQWWSLFIFGASMLMVYGSSTLYHSATQARVKYYLRKLDHISIYFLIAGTHTPFLVFYLPNRIGMIYLIIIWGTVLAGTIYKTFFFDRWPWLSLSLYLLMGWMGAFTIPFMWDQMPASIFWNILWGGLAYTSGVVFFVWHKLPYHHAIWHLFVLAGTGFHFWAIWMMVVKM
jgi:hemolysin III